MSETEEQMFTDEELEEAAHMEEVETEKTKPRSKKSVKTFIDPVKLKHDIAINPVDVSDGFLNQASLFAHYGMQAARAAEQMDNTKLILETKEALLNNHHREALTATGAKITEAMITNAVKADKAYIAARRMQNEAKGVLEMNKVAAEAFKQRRDMLIQVGADAREERKGEMYMSKPHSPEETAEKHEDLRNRARKVNK